MIERQCVNMVRDGIRDKAYFDSAINELNKRVSLYKQRLSTGGVVSQNIKLAKNMLVNMEYQIILLRYSRGDNLSDIRETMMQMIDLFEECIDQSEYFSVTKFLSLAILLNIDMSYVLKCFKSINAKYRSDWFISFIVCRYCNIEFDNNLKVLDNRFAVYKDIAAGNADELSVYLNKIWYGSFKDQPWYDSHKAKGNAYKGYFCFEAGAIVKVLSLDDSNLKNCQYYPYGLVHFET